MKNKQKLTLGDKIASILSCLGDHYVNRDVNTDDKLEPSACNGCDGREACQMIRMTIRIEKLHKKIYARERRIKPERMDHLEKGAHIGKSKEVPKEINKEGKKNVKS